MTIPISNNPYAFGWVQAQLKLSSPKQLIIKTNPNTPQVIPAIVPNHIVMAIAQQQFDLERLWKVIPQTYPFNGVISKIYILELPTPKRKPPEPNAFMIAGTVMEVDTNAFKLLPPKSQDGIVIQGALPPHYKCGDVLYTKARLQDNRTLQLERCCSDLDYAISKQKARPLTFTLSHFPEFLPVSPQKGKAQFWVHHGSEHIAVLVNDQQIQDLETLKSGHCQATITGRVQRIKGLVTVHEPMIQTSIRNVALSNQTPFSSKKNDSPRARLLGKSLA